VPKARSRPSKTHRWARDRPSLNRLIVLELLAAGNTTASKPPNFCTARGEGKDYRLTSIVDFGKPALSTGGAGQTPELRHRGFTILPA